MKKILAVFLCLLMVFSVCACAQASGLTIRDSADVLEEGSQFPFWAETDELAVNVRKSTSTKSEKVGRLERGTQLTVLSAELNNSGEVWYAVELPNGIKGYIRSDLLIRSEKKEIASDSAPNGKENGAFEDGIVSFKAKATQSAVNVRREASTSSGKVGQIKRGEILTVVSQMTNSVGELWYAVQLVDGTTGYIRSDLLIETNETEIKKASYQNTGSRKTTTQKSTANVGSGKYIGNKNSKKFHRSSCHTLPKESNRIYFSSRDKAISSGYKPCKNCDP